MATLQTISIPAGVATPIVTGTGQKVLLQVAHVSIGTAAVTIGNGIFISGGPDFIDLGKVAIGETIYAISEIANEAKIFYFDIV